MIGINLLPDVKKEFIKAQRTRNTVISLSIVIMIGVGIATVALASFVYVGQQTLIGITENDIAEKQKTLESKPEITKYLTVQNQLNTLETLHGSDYKVVYSRLLDYLPKLNPAAPHNVALSSVEVMHGDASIKIVGTVADFQSLGIFKNTLENAKVTYVLNGSQEETPLFSEVVLQSAALAQNNNTTNVSFEFDVTYAEDAFRPDASNVQLVVPKLTISDAQNSAPSSSELFSSQGAN